MAQWAIKSESDTDRVWAELDHLGYETGAFRYEFFATGLEAEIRPRSKRAERRRAALLVSIGATVPTAVYALSRVVG